MNDLKEENYTCVSCGCTDNNACDGGCEWIEIYPEESLGICSSDKCRKYKLEVERKQLTKIEIQTISFNRYQLLEIEEDKKRVDLLMRFANSYAKKTKPKMLTIYTPKKRRGNYETRIIQHYDLNSVITYLENKIVGNDTRFVKRWKSAVKDFKNLKLHIQREQVISVLMDQYEQDEQWLRQFSYIKLKELLDGLLFEKSDE